MICMLLSVQLLQELPFQLFYLGSLKMLYCRPSCSLTKLFGSIDQAFTRTKNVQKYSAGYRCSSVCTTLVEIGEIGRVSKSIKKLSKELKGTDKRKNEEYRAKVKISNERSLALIKAAMDIVVAAGLLQLSPKKITPRVTGAFGFATSLISCYQLLPSAPKSKTS